MLTRIGVFAIATLLIWTSCAHSAEISGDIAGVTALRAEGKTRDAVKALRKILAESPGNAHAWVQLGAALQDLGDAKQAESAYRKALQIEPENAAAGRNLDHLISSRLARTPISDRNPSHRFLIQRGLSAMKERRFRDALVTFRVLSALSPNDWDWVFYSARALEGLGKHREATDVYHMILEAEPEYSSAWVNLIVAHIESGNADQAAHLTESALGAVPDDQRIRYLARRLGLKRSPQSAAGRSPIRPSTNSRQ